MSSCLRAPCPVLSWILTTAPRPPNTQKHTAPNTRHALVLHYCPNSLRGRPQKGTGRDSGQRTATQATVSRNFYPELSMFTDLFEKCIFKQNWEVRTPRAGVFVKRADNTTLPFYKIPIKLTNDKTMTLTTFSRLIRCRICIPKHFAPETSNSLMSRNSR